MSLQPQHSPDVSQRDLSLHSNGKYYKGQRFVTVEDVKEKKLLNKLKALPKSAFKRCFEDWKDVGIIVLYTTEGGNVNLDESRNKFSNKHKSHELFDHPQKG